MTIKPFNALIITLSMIVLTACETSASRDDIVTDMEAVLQDSVKTNEEQGAIPENVSSALIPSISLGSTDVPALGNDDQRFDISVNNVPADQFFLSLVDGTTYNMVVHPEVIGAITLNLRNVTIPEVMDAVRDVYGYEFVKTQYGYQVLPGRLRARIYQINYLNVERSGSSQTFVSSGSLSGSNNNNSNNNNQNSDTGNNGPETSGSSGSNTRLTGTQISTRQPESVFWVELQSSVQTIVGSGEGRSVVVNPQSGVVVVRALPNELREVESFLTATQLIVQRQVILEAKIVEVSLSDGFQSGINWAGLLTHNNKSVTIGQTGGGSILSEGGLSDIAGNSGILDPSNYLPIEGTNASAFGGVFSMALNLGDFTSFIELLETQGNVRVLSSPRVATMNNQKAVIKVGTDEFFVTEVTNTTITGVSSTNVSPSVTLTPFFSGIALDVTPQISQDGMVTLHVHPSVSDVKDQQKTITIGDEVQQLPLALSSIRESDSIVRARSGQVIVIGGLMQDNSTNRNAGTPGISRVPLIGNLFKQKSESSVKSELVILLKPIVVNDTDQWTDTINEYSRSLDNLRENN